MTNKITTIIEKYFGFALVDYYISTKLEREDFFEPSSAHLKVACQLQKLLASRLEVVDVSVTWVNNNCFNVKIDGTTYGVRTVVFKQ
ncbi:MAG: hypothetical protein WC179_07925 [Candidatus Cloacimonadaceae bacterium]